MFTFSTQLIKDSGFRRSSHQRDIAPLAHPQGLLMARQKDNSPVNRPEDTIGAASQSLAQLGPVLDSVFGPTS